MIKPMNPVEEYRKENGYSQAEMAELLACSQASIVNYEKDNLNPTAKTIQRIKQATGGVVDLKVWMNYHENLRIYKDEKEKEMEGIL